VTRHYKAAGQQLLRCARCGTLIESHRDDRGQWTGCPYGELTGPRPCAYNGCSSTDIEDQSLWLCAEHVPARTLRRLPR
jgi:hypothetical protein